MSTSIEACRTIEQADVFRMNDFANFQSRFDGLERAVLNLGQEPKSDTASPHSASSHPDSNSNASNTIFPDDSHQGQIDPNDAMVHTLSAQVYVTPLNDRILLM